MIAKRAGLLIVALAILLIPALVHAQDEVVYYHTDAVGSVRMTTDASGAVIHRYDYLPFGEAWDPPSNPDVRRFAGQERDAETGLDYFGARYSRAQSGRFTTVDPVLNADAALSNPQRWNRYAYALNNPTRFIDPDGRDTIDLVIGFGQGIGSALAGIVTTPIALITNPSAVGNAIASDLRLLGHGIANPSDVLDTYVNLATSSNDRDQRALGAAIGQGATTAALILAPTAKGGPGAATTGPKIGSAGGPGAGKAFSRVTKGEALAESPNCVFCGEPTTKGSGPTQSNIDHAIPKSRGGNNTIENAQNTCRTCNLRKGTQTTEEFLEKKR